MFTRKKERIAKLSHFHTQKFKISFARYAITTVSFWWITKRFSRWETGLFEIFYSCQCSICGRWKSASEGMWVLKNWLLAMKILMAAILTETKAQPKAIRNWEKWILRREFEKSVCGQNCIFWQDCHWKIKVHKRNLKNTSILNVLCTQLSFYFLKGGSVLRWS